MELENTFTVPTGIDETWEAFNDPRQIAPCFPGATLESYQDESFTGTVKVKLGPISLTYQGKGTFVERDEAAHRVVIVASGRDARGNGTANATVTGTLTAAEDAEDAEARTMVTMVTDLTITGRPAQFGRGVMAEVSDKIIGQFSACLARRLGASAEPTQPPAAEPTQPSGAGAAAPRSAEGTASAEQTTGAESAARATTASAAAVGTATATPAAGTASSNGSAPDISPAPEPVPGEVEAIDLLDTVGAPVLRRLAPVVKWVAPALGALALLVVVLRVVKSRKS